MKNPLHFKKMLEFKLNKSRNTINMYFKIKGEIDVVGLDKDKISCKETHTVLKILSSSPPGGTLSRGSPV